VTGRRDRGTGVLSRLVSLFPHPTSHFPHLKWTVLLSRYLQKTRETNTAIKTPNRAPLRCRRQQRLLLVLLDCCHKAEASAEHHVTIGNGKIAHTFCLMALGTCDNCKVKTPYRGIGQHSATMSMIIVDLFICHLPLDKAVQIITEFFRCH
jgi:hypothetical protein